MAVGNGQSPVKAHAPGGGRLHFYSVVILGRLTDVLLGSSRRTVNLPNLKRAHKLGKMPGVAA